MDHDRICISKLRDRNKTKPLDDTDKPAEFPEFVRSENRILLGEAMKILTDEERKVIILKAVAGLKHKEIATVLGMTPSTVRSKYHRAIKRLKQYLTRGGAFRE